MSSLRLRLIAGLLATLTTLSLLDSLWSYRDAYHETEEIFDAHLAQYARIVHNLLADALPQADQPILVWRAPLETRGVGHSYERKLNFQVWRGDRLAARSAAADAQRPYAPLRAGYQNARGNGSDWRVFTLPDPDHGLMIQVAERGDVRGEMAEMIARRTLSKNLALIPLTAVLVAWLVSQGLAPLKALVADIAARRPDRLDPLPFDGLPRELRPIIVAINELMARLAQALAQERRFTSDAAHELRTPLALVRLQIEGLALADEAGRQIAHQRLLKGIDRLSRTVSQMLLLARLEQAADRMPMTPVDLKALLEASVAELAPAAVAKDQDLSLAVPAEACVLGHAQAEALAILMRNLLDNAIRYTPSGGRIGVTLDLDEAHARLAVEDSGPGVPEAMRERIWERFFRPPGMESPGSGLGLSIVRQVLELHGGVAQGSPGDAGRGWRVEVRLPLR
ncbi:MAG: ATP-binding protein [Pseudomonadota bacterium]